MTQKDLDELTYKILGCAIEVHKELGPGLLETIYEKCLLQELKNKRLSTISQFFIPVNYKGIQLDCELKPDILVEDKVVVELKAVDSMHPIFEAQLLTYMKLLQKPKGVLINFNCLNIFKDGQKTLVNDLYAKLPKQ